MRSIESASPFKTNMPMTPVLVSLEGINTTTHGGKAASLSRLRSLGLLVPKAWVIPCEYSLSRPEIDLSEIAGYLKWTAPATKFAVRSGAPVSMPGLLNTRLNVPVEDLPAAITAVWDSWHAEHAKAYREAKGISEGIGTAVIIQVMVDVDCAGVAFSNDPTNVENTDEFKPVIEYVKGLGEQLVGGEVQPEKATGEEEWYSRLVFNLKKIHNTYGPSDVEWAYSKSGALYFVQQRALRFTGATIACEVPENCTFLVKGRAIGAPMTLTTRVYKIETANIPPGSAVYVSQFKPELYPVMVKAAAIICESGGETCHAAIVSRELNKPAVSGISRLQASELLAGRVFIDGIKGNIYNYVGKVDEETHTDAALDLTVYDPKRKPNISLTSHAAFDVCLMLYRFYHVLDQHRQGLVSDERKNEVVDEIAEIICTYFYLACLTEMRHLRQRTTLRTDSGYKRGRLYPQFKKLGLKIPSKRSPMNFTKNNSREGYSMHVPQPASTRDAAKMMELCVEGFNKAGWHGGYGGKRWGAIASVVWEYLRGTLTSVMFVDACFNLKHNNGAAFDKFSWIEANSHLMQQQLNAKFTGTIADVLRITQYYRTSSKSLNDFAAQTSII